MVGRLVALEFRQGRRRCRPAENREEDESVEVVLTPEAVERAEIKTTAARSVPASATLTVPGTITSNAYRDTKVNALVGGVVRQVTVELGTAVTRGQLLTVIFSAELAEEDGEGQSRAASLTARYSPSSAYATQDW